MCEDSLAIGRFTLQKMELAPPIWFDWSQKIECVGVFVVWKTENDEEIVGKW